MVIAERIINYYDDQGTERDLLVQVHLPERDDNAWRCAYSMGAPFHRESCAYGADAAQALSLALVKLGIDLNHPPARLRGKLISSEPNFGFPVLAQDIQTKAA